MQGLFGRFGKQKPEQSISFSADRRQHRELSQTEIDDREFASVSNFDDDEETNWDDAETLADENNPIVYSQPIVPAVAPPPPPTVPDLEEWDEALPAATVKNSSSQEVRRGKQTPIPAFKTEDIWADDLPTQTVSTNTGVDPDLVSPDRVNRAIGFWSAILQQFRRFLPAPIRKLSDAILTAILVLLVTVTIWFVDGFFVPNSTPSSVAKPPPTTVAEPNTSLAETPTIAITPKISPEQAFIEAIETQLSEITNQYPDDIVRTLSIDLPRDRAIVRLNPVWYTLGDERQTSLADRMWLQAQANHFTKLELQDDRGISIARSPVVGKQMIIVQRHQS